MIKFMDRNLRSLYIWGIPICLAFTMLLPNLANAEQCESEDEPVLERPSVNGPLFSEEIFDWHTGTWFKIPFGYMNPWWGIREDELGGRNLERYIAGLSANSARTGYDIETGLYNPDLVEDQKDDPWSGRMAFWMPSGRYVEHNMMWGAPFRPCEAGRTHADENQYVVRFHMIWAGEGAENTKFARNSKDSLIIETHDISHKSFIEGEVAFAPICLDYACSYEIWIKERNLILYMVVPRRGYPEDSTDIWIKPLETLVTLIESWEFEEGDAQ